MPKKNGKKKKLPDDYSPCKYAVLCGRGSKCTKSTGNQRLKKLVNHYLKPYSEASNKVEKSAIVTAIIQSTKDACPDGGGFVKFEDGRWWEVEDAFAREKIGCLFRDCLHTQYKSSTKSKLARRKAMDDQFYGSSHIGNTSSHSSLSGNSGHTSSYQEELYHQQRMMSYNMQQQQHHAMSLMDPTGHAGMMQPASKMNDYCSLLQNYLGQANQPHPTQQQRPYRQDFFRECMTNNPIPYNARVSTGSLLEQACNLVEDAPGDPFEEFADVFEGGNREALLQDSFAYE